MNTRAIVLLALMTAGNALGAANPMPAPIAPDYNGDGFSDVLAYGTVDQPTKATAYVDCRGMRGTQPVIDSRHLISETWRPGWEIYPGDFDGDGKDDIFLYDPTRNKGTGHLVRITEDCHTQSSVAVAEDAWRTTWEVYPGDFDGDGADDLFLYDPTGPKGVGHLVRFDEDGLIYSSHPVTEQWRTSWEIQTGDFDGDGKDDLFLFDRTPGEAVGHLVRFNAQGYIQSSHPVGSGYTEDTEFYPGDYDGDGDYDLLLMDRYAPFGAEVRIQHFDTNGNVALDTLIAQDWAPYFDVTVADLSGNGRADLFLYAEISGKTFSYSATFNAQGQLHTFQLINKFEQQGSVMFPGNWWEGQGVDLMKVQSSTGITNVSRFGTDAVYAETSAFSTLTDIDMGFNGFYDF